MYQTTKQSVSRLTIDAIELAIEEALGEISHMTKLLQHNELRLDEIKQNKTSSEVELADAQSKLRFFKTSADVVPIAEYKQVLLDIRNLTDTVEFCKTLVKEFEIKIESNRERLESARESLQVLESELNKRYEPIRFNP